MFARGLSRVHPLLGVGADVAADGVDAIRFSRGMMVGLLLRDRDAIKRSWGWVERWVRRRRQHGRRVGHGSDLVVCL